MADDSDSTPTGPRTISTGDITSDKTLITTGPVNITQTVPAWKVVSNVTSLAIFLLASWVYLKGFEGATSAPDGELLSAYRTRLTAAALAYLPAILFNIARGEWVGSFRDAILTGSEQIGLFSSCMLCVVVGLITLWAFAADDQTKRSVMDGIKFMFGAAAGAAVQRQIQGRNSGPTRQEKK